MSEVIERVAAAICEAAGSEVEWVRVDPRLWASMKGQARAAIEAMREPTKAVLEEMAEAERRGRLWTKEKRLALVLNAAIDAALK